MLHILTFGVYLIKRLHMRGESDGLPLIRNKTHMIKVIFFKSQICRMEVFYEVGSRPMSLLILLIYISVLPGCGAENPEPAVSRAPYFSEIYTVHTLCTARVNSVFLFETEDDPSSSYLIMECAIQEVLAPSIPNIDFRTEDEVLVWADITQIKTQEESLTELFLSTDVLIVNGKLREVHFSPNTSSHDSFVALWGKESLTYTVSETEDTVSVLELPPCLFPELRYWGILPIRNSILDASAMESAMAGDVVFSLDEIRPEEGLYFQNGDGLKNVCSALERYVVRKEFVL